MIAELTGLKARIETLTYPAFIVWATTPPAQYVVLGAKGWESPESALCTTSSSIDTDIRVRAVTGTPEGVVIMLDRIRNLLSPSLAETKITVAGRDVAIRFVRSEFIDIDQDTTITGTNRHPAFGVDTYRLISEPV